MKKLRLGILGSGKGSNFSAILHAIEQGRLNAEIALVISDVSTAGIIQLAKDVGVAIAVFTEPRFRTRMSEEGEQEMAELLTRFEVDWVVLAGYMRIVKAPLLRAFPNRIINIHPSLLPKYPGLAPWKQALDAGESGTGCTVHLVNEGIDAGQIVAQALVPILPGDTAESVHRKIQIEEHRLYPEVLARIANAEGFNPFQ